MKPFLEDISLLNDSSFAVKRDMLPHINVPLHFHPECEWVLNLQGTGKRFVGDSIMDFTAGDLVFLGGYLPHFWKNSTAHYVAGSTLKADVVVVHFKKEAFGKMFFALPEMRKINRFLEMGKRGIAITGKSQLVISDRLMTMLSEDSTARFISLLEILKFASENEDDWEILSVNDYSAFTAISGSERLIKVFQYVSENYDSPITLADAAGVANMNKTAFSRYFKLKTRKTFVTYLNEVRVNYAKKLLLAHATPVNTVSYDCGFNNPSYFNKIFRSLVGQTPSEYRLLNR